MYDIQHCFICRPTDSTVSEDAGIEPRPVATRALAVRRSNHSARSHPHSTILTEPFLPSNHSYHLDHEEARVGEEEEVQLLHNPHDVRLGQQVVQASNPDPDGRS
jgi:hypothetical protein